MKFSERHELMRRAEKYCEDNGVKPSPFNIISALDVLGCLKAAQPSERTAEQRCKKHSVVYCAECYPAVKTRRR